MHVPDDGEQLPVVLDEVRPEAALEDVSAAPVPPVEALRVDGVQPLHPGRDVRERRVHDQVDVRGHEAVRDALPAAAVDDVVEQPVEDVAVRLAAEEDLAEPGVDAEVVRRAGELGAWRPRHCVTVRARRSRIGARHTFGAEPARSWFRV
ncbi:MAG TPA: hypothetical protein VM290_05770 [Gaiellaceae bacterium]|nr:hypothetical protein [Gaiellaceae bacterium]